MDKHGADAVRWFMAASGSPWAARRVGDGTITETVRKVLLTYWNTVAFHALYANANHYVPGGRPPRAPPRSARHPTLLLRRSRPTALRKVHPQSRTVMCWTAGWSPPPTSWSST